MMIIMGATGLLQLGAAAVSLLGLGLFMGFSPTLYGVTLHLLVQDRRAMSAIHWMVGGLFVGSTILVILFQFVDPENLERLLKNSVDSLLLLRGVDIIAGTLLITASAVLALRVRGDRLRPAHRRTNPDVPERPRRAFLVGLSNTVIGVSGIATMYLTGRVVSSVSTSLVIRAAFYLIFAVTLIGPYLLAGYLWQRNPRFAARTRHGYESIMSRDFRKPVAAALFLAGLAFIGIGVLYGTV